MDNVKPEKLTSVKAVERRADLKYDGYSKLLHTGREIRLMKRAYVAGGSDVLEDTQRAIEAFVAGAAAKRAELEKEIVRLTLELITLKN